MASWRCAWSMRGQPGFRDWPDGFRVLEYWLDEDVFPDGFSPGDAA